MFNLRQIAEIDPVSSPEVSEVLPLHDDESRYRSAPHVAKWHAADAEGMLPWRLLPQAGNLAFSLELWFLAFGGTKCTLVGIGLGCWMDAQM